MSTPPPPAPFGSPAGVDRKTLRAQQRMAEAQARLQRDRVRAQNRAQMQAQRRAARRNSIVGPILLLTLGVVLLLLQTSRLHWAAALTWLGHWWPAVLILAGLLMLAEWVFDRRQLSAVESPLPPRRFLGAGTVALLVLLAMAGATVMAAENGSVWLRRNLDDNFRNRGWDHWRETFGLRSDFTNNLRAPLSPTGTLTVENPRGDVTITGSSADGEAHVTVHQHIFAWQMAEGDQKQRNEKVRLNGNGNHLVLTAPAEGEDYADLTIELPHGAAVVVHSSHGDVTLEELRGSVDVAARGGDVKLTALRGPVHLQTQDDDATITAHSLGSGLTLEGRSGDIDLSDIDGPVSLHGDFFGTTHLEHIRGTVRFQSSFTDFACAGIPGDLHVEGRSDLDAHQLLGPVTIATTNRNLALEGVRGATTISDRNGAVSVELAGLPQPVRITNENGSIALSVPRGQGFSVQARTQNGKIDNDFGFEAHQRAEAADLNSKIGGGGPLLFLETSEGDVRLKQSPGTPDASWSDEPRKISPAPAHR